MDPKLAFLALLFGAIIGLSLVDDANLARLRERLTHRFGRKGVLAARKS